MYVVERWLARLSSSPYADDFVLKGGMLLASFGNRRPTVDADTLARHMPAEHDAVARRVTQIASLRAADDDGVEFLVDTVTTSTIRDDALYSGVRVVMDARLATAQVKLRLDVNFGDPVTPAPRVVELPALRPDTPPIRILGYPVETVLAEKLVTAMALGRANTRVRDFADVHLLTGSQRPRCEDVRSAIAATADFRGVAITPLREATAGLAALRASTYGAYRRALGSAGGSLPSSLADLLDAVAVFADPVVTDLDPHATWDPDVRTWRGAPTSGEARA